MAGAYSFATQLGIDSANPVTKRFNFLRCGLRQMVEHVPTHGNMGTRSIPSERNREGLKRVGGPLLLRPNTVELNLLLEWILGGTPIVGTPAGKTTFPVGDTLPTRYITVDLVSKVPTWAGCAVDTAVLRSTQGGPLEVELDIVGQTETLGDAASFPSLAIDRTQAGFMHSELVLTINSVAHKCPDFELTIANMIDRDRFFNSQTLTSVQATGRVISLRTKLPYGDSSAAYNLATAGVSASGVWTNGNYSLNATIAALMIPPETPTIEGGNGELFLDINGVCGKVGATAGTTDELSMILDLTA